MYKELIYPPKPAPSENKHRPYCSPNQTKLKTSLPAHALAFVASSALIATYCSWLPSLPFASFLPSTGAAAQQRLSSLNFGRGCLVAFMAFMAVPLTGLQNHSQAHSQSPPPTCRACADSAPAPVCSEQIVHANDAANSM